MLRYLPATMNVHCLNPAVADPEGTGVQGVSTSVRNEGGGGGGGGSGGGGG